MGYGIVERTGGRLRAVDYGCLTTSRRPAAARSPAPRSTRCVAELIETHQPDLARGRAAVLLEERPERVRRRPGPRRRAARRGAGGRARPRGDAQRGQGRRHGLRQRGQGAGRADGRRDPPAGRGARTPTTRPMRWRSRSATANAERAGDRVNGGTAGAKAGVLDRAAIAPIARGETPYERAVREAIATRGPGLEGGGRHQGPRLGPRPRDRVGRGQGRGGRGRLAGHRGRRHRLPGVRRAVGHRHRDARRAAQAPHLPPRPRGPAGAVRVPDAGGAGVLQPAAHGDRRGAEGRAGDRRVAGHGGPPARDPPAGPGGPRRRSRASARSSPSGSSSSSRRRCPRPVSRPARPTAVASASEGEVVAALQALGYSLGEAREASRLALNDATVGAGLEERVKAALRTLLRD